MKEKTIEQFQLVCNFVKLMYGVSEASVGKIKNYFGWATICQFFGCPLSEVIADELIRLEFNKKD